MSQRLIQPNISLNNKKENTDLLIQTFVSDSENKITNIEQNWLENPLSSVDNPTYYLKLFMISDDDTISLEISKDPIEYLKNIKNAVIVAESGSTAINIESLTYTTAVSIGYNNRSVVLTEGQMRLYEPMGLSFYDKLILAAKTLGIRNFTKSPFYLEVRFHGYDEQGNYLGSIGSTLNEKRSWFYRIIITDIKTSLGPEGTIYDIKFSSHDDVATYDKFFKISSPFSPQGKTVRDIINEIIKSKEQDEIDAYGYVRNKYKFTFVPLNSVVGGFNVTNIISKLNPFDWEIDDNSFYGYMNTTSNSQPNKKEVNFTRGESISNILEQIFVNTEEGQALTRRSNIPRQYGSDYEFIILWNIVPIIKIRQDQPYDWVYNDYNYEIEYVIVPYLSARGVGTVKQQLPIIEKNAEKLEEKLRLRIETKRLRKKYEYLFTGLNTEVLNVDLNFDMLWKAIIPSYGGANTLGLNSVGKIYSKDNIYVLTSQIRQDYNKINQYEREISKIKSELNSKNFSSSPFVSTNPSEDELRKRLEVLSSQVKVLRSSVEEKRLKLSQDVEEKNNERKKMMTYERFAYLEDFDIFNNNITLPVTIDSSIRNSNFYGRGNIDTKKPIDQAMATAILNQIQSGNLIEIDLLIRGDPFWLGTTHLEKNRYFLTNANLSPDLPVFTSGEYYFVLKFKVPIGVDETTIDPIIRKNDFFTGIYIVHTIQNNFNGGIFTQNLKAVRDVNSDISILNI